MKLVQVVLPDDQLSGSLGGYFNYEFGFLSEQQPTRNLRCWVDFPVMSPEITKLDEDEEFSGTREQYIVKQEEVNLIGDFE